MNALSLKRGILAIAIGAAVGVGGYTFVYAKGYSYLANDPASCANCHVMNGQYDAWLKGSHRSVATCNDCHTPDGVIAKYASKANNGFWHSFAFTTGYFHEPIQIGARNREIAEQACRKCHEDVVEAMEGPHRTAGELSCISCHNDVGHWD